MVTQDIPPYAVVAGNPAKVIKYRFPEACRRQMLAKLDYTVIDQKFVTENIDMFYKAVDEDIELPVT